MDRRKNNVNPESKLRELSKQDCNSKCADCGAAKPRYASITLGIFLCNRCYGIHRSIGAHITRTKCIGLDNWSTHEVNLMTSVGNAVASAYWEKNVPNGYSIPTSDSPDAVVEKWIRDKYEKKLFCPPHLPPPHVTKQQQNSHHLGAGNPSRGQVLNDDWTPFISANLAGDFSASNPCSNAEVWDPFGDNVTHSNR
ncbi:hypothetical protein SUGI_1145370 [Cryptomeria japonica]|uniref:uncharacterized protein C824.09c n=1 Tax=Cryptomeria japonica TaxID=3369 RepID=UPI0024149384|nr:uncharacterized protein C824.09c [Cryptomeria japonica]GLJ53688.1 hypothetical protein SUGI_1145370 [Cryptomeria japonica]